MGDEEVGGAYGEVRRAFAVGGCGSEERRSGGTGTNTRFSRASQQSLFVPFVLPRSSYLSFKLGPSERMVTLDKERAARRANAVGASIERRPSRVMTFSRVDPLQCLSTVRVSSPTCLNSCVADTWLAVLYDLGMYMGRVMYVTRESPTPRELELGGHKVFGTEQRLDDVLLQRYVTIIDTYRLQ
ncbi:hypothetical protein B0H11DRAFT_1915111 [Mycena galericulata]|nr:hypothetical protein B0H11DRAFT_1915111 [Mycena galericulata]